MRETLPACSNEDMNTNTTATERTPDMHTMTLTLGTEVLSAWMTVADKDEAAAVVALFPKSYGLKANHLHTYNGQPLGAVTATARLIANDVNGGENETGRARFAKIAAKARAIGFDVVEETAP